MADENTSQTNLYNSLISTQGIKVRVEVWIETYYLFLLGAVIFMALLLALVVVKLIFRDQK